jgi:hypothetical protein
MGDDEKIKSIDDTIDELREDINANRDMIIGILSGLFDNNVTFEDTGYEGYRPHFVYGVDGKHLYEHDPIDKVFVAKAVCEKTGGEFDWEKKKCRYRWKLNL